MYWIMSFLFYNKDAIIALPTEVKWFAVAVLAISIVSGILRNAWKLVKIAVIVAAIYFALTTFGII